MTCYASREEIEEESEREWMYALTERNMRKMYEQTWGGTVGEERELNHQCAIRCGAREREREKMRQSEGVRALSIRIRRRRRRVGVYI